MIDWHGNDYTIEHYMQFVEDGGDHGSTTAMNPQLREGV
jgi:hypothetical protein